MKYAQERLPLKRQALLLSASSLGFQWLPLPPPQEKTRRVKSVDIEKQAESPYFTSSEMECYAGMEKPTQDIERDDDWNLRCLRKLKITNLLTMCKLDTIIYASEDGSYSVFTLNPDLQKQLADFATRHPEACFRKERKGEGGGICYQITSAYRFNSS